MTSSELHRLEQQLVNRSSKRTSKSFEKGSSRTSDSYLLVTTYNTIRQKKCLYDDERVADTRRLGDLAVGNVENMQLEDTRRESPAMDTTDLARPINIPAEEPATQSCAVAHNHLPVESQQVLQADHWKSLLLRAFATINNAAYWDNDAPSIEESPQFSEPEEVEESAVDESTNPIDKADTIPSQRDFGNHDKQSGEPPYGHLGTSLLLRIDRKRSFKE